MAFGSCINVSLCRRIMSDKNPSLSHPDTTHALRNTSFIFGIRLWNRLHAVLHAQPSTQLARGNRSPKPQDTRTDACPLFGLKMSRLLPGSRVCVCTWRRCEPLRGGRYKFSRRHGLFSVMGCHVRL